MTKKQRIRLITAWVGSKVDPEAAYAALEALRRTGPLTASRVVDAARDPLNPLHAAFEWDDAVAADLYRAEQARRLIRAVVIVSSDATPLRVYVHVPSSDREGQYLPGEVVVKEVDMFRSVLSEVMDDIRSALTRLVDLRAYAEAAGDESRRSDVTVAVESLTTAEAALSRM